MTWEVLLVLGLLAAAIVLFAIERLPVDVVALAILAVLLVTGVLTPKEAFSGFSSDAVIVIGGLFVLTTAFRRTGAVDRIGAWIRRRAGDDPRRALLLLLPLVALFSAFMNNTTCTAIFLPFTLALARHAKVAPSKLLMPVAFASILGGSMTLVGTSTNVIVAELLPTYGQQELGMFELLPVALPVALAGLVYLVLVSDRLLPERGGGPVEESYSLREYLTDLDLPAGSPLVGETVAGADLRGRWGLSLVAVVRGEGALDPEPELALAAGDMLVLEGPADAVWALRRESALAAHRGPDSLEAALEGRELRLAEVVVPPRSDAVGRTLAEVDFRRRFRANVIAIARSGELETARLADARLRAGDLLLVVAPADEIEGLGTRPGLLLVSGGGLPAAPSGSPWIAGGILALTVALAALQVLPLAAAVLLGCLLVFLTRSLTPQEAYAGIDWRLLVLVAGMIGLGLALQETGAAALLAARIVDLAGGAGPVALLAGFYGLTLLLTQPMSNQAAALVVLPLAMEVAAETGFDPRAMAVAVALAASSSFLTPLEPSCLLVYGPGRYRFVDFPRLGLGLTAVAFLLALALIPRFWPS